MREKVKEWRWKKVEIDEKWNKKIKQKFFKRRRKIEREKEGEEHGEL